MINSMYFKLIKNTKGSNTKRSHEKLKPATKSGFFLLDSFQYGEKMKRINDSTGETNYLNFYHSNVTASFILSKEKKCL